jgi:hypothetical protein
LTITIRLTWLADCPRTHQAGDLAQSVHMPREGGSHAKAAPEQRGELNGDVRQRADDDAGHQTVDTNGWRKHDRAQDDAEVVKDGRDGGEREGVLRLQHPLRRRAESEQQWREQQQPGQVDREILTLRG